MAGSKKIQKIWKASSNSSAGFMVTPDSVVMAGSASSFIAIGSNGTSIAGPVSFLSLSDQVRRAGLFTEMNDFIKMVPSTIVTPIPPLVPFPPLSFVSNAIRGLAFIVAMQAG
jgi:hypothetical protein